MEMVKGVKDGRRIVGEVLDMASPTPRENLPERKAPGGLDGEKTKYPPLHKCGAEKGMRACSKAGKNRLRPGGKNVGSPKTGFRLKKKARGEGGGPWGGASATKREGHGNSKNA